MKVLVIALVILVVTNLAEAANVGGILSQTLAVHKAAAGKHRKERRNIAHNDGTKIKVATANKREKVFAKDEALEVASQTPVANATAETDAIANRQNNFNNGQQLAMSVLTMVLSRMIFKLDYKNPKTLLACRVTFCLYVVLSQVRSLRAGDYHASLL